MPKTAKRSSWKGISQLFRNSEKTKNKPTSNHFSAGIGQLALDVYETKTAIKIVAPLAGVDLDEIEIFLENDVLTIRGERKNDLNAGLRKYISQECFWGKFARSIVLPSNIQAGKIKAVAKNGILKIGIPKTVSVKSKMITIEQ